MEILKLKDSQFNELLRLCNLYYREAEKCEKSKAYLAGCIMLGATLEAALLAFSYLFSSEIPEELIPKYNGKTKNLLSWDLSQLLKIARKCNWLPARLNVDEDWNHRKAHIGDYVIVLKDIRNLIHAGRYIRDFSNMRITKKRMLLCFETLEIATDYLLKKIYKSIDSH